LLQHLQPRDASTVDKVTVRVQVVASAPLLRVGLERAALAAGFEVSDGPGRAAIGLHSADVGPTGAGVDLSVGANTVTVVLNALPDPKSWTAMLALLDELFDHTSGDDH
jgi:hypothetical protein